MAMGKQRWCKCYSTGAILVFAFICLNLWYSPGKHVMINKKTSVDKIVLLRMKGMFQNNTTLNVEDVFSNKEALKKANAFYTETYVGCFQQIDQWEMLHGLTTETGSSKFDTVTTCLEKDSSYVVTLPHLNVLKCGSSIRKEYILYNRLLQGRTLNDCVTHSESEKLYAVSMVEKAPEPTSSKICLSQFTYPTAVVKTTIQDTGLCRLACRVLNYVLAADDSRGICFCTNTTEWKPLSETCQSSDPTMNLTLTGVPDTRCNQRRFLPPKSAPLTALLSFPGSGNTWVRHLIELATGIYSGSIYLDEDIYSNGFLGEVLPWDSGRTAVIKTHKHLVDVENVYDKIIYLIRNPFDAIVAEFNRLHGGQTGHAPYQSFRSQEWLHFIPYKMAKWTNTSFSYINHDTPLMTVYYEDLVAHPGKEINRMLDWIGIPIADREQRFACTLNSLSGKVHRKKKPLPYSPYNKHMVELVNRHIASVRNLIRNTNHKDLPWYERELTQQKYPQNAL